MFTTDLSKIPSKPGVYLFKDAKGTILYIGKAKNLQKRIWQYFSPNSLRKQEMLEKATKVDFLFVKNESEALYLEDNLIKQHQPEYNNLLKADNSYIYIKITKEKFPQIFMTRKKMNDWALYIGPKSDTIQLKKFLQYLRQILKFRGCKATQFKQGKLCSDYYFWLCRGRCKLTKSLPVKGGNEGGFIKDYQNIIHTITSFFKGNTKPIEQEIHKQITEAVSSEHFEYAANLRDIYLSLQGFVEKQNVVLQDKQDGYLSLIKTVGSQNIYTVLIFVQGKLIDVITSKQPIDDLELDSLELAIQRAFGEGIVQENKNEIQIISKTFAKTGKIITKELWKLAENFLESYIISQSLQQENTLINDMVKTLKERYGLKKIPYRIECIDISHLSGWRTSGWLSCMLWGLPYKKWYRRYKIQWRGTRNKEQGGKNNSSHVPVPSSLSDDYASLEEVLERRFFSLKSSSLKSKVEKKDFTDIELHRPSTEFPDLIILDWGKGQLGVVKKLCKNPERKKIVSQIDIISLGKWEARKKWNIGKISRRDDDLSRLNSKITEKIYTLDKNLKIHENPMVYDQADKIFLKARDEAHRFANSYRKKQMSQERK